MHIEPGFVAPVKVMAANAAAAGVVAWGVFGSVSAALAAPRRQLAELVRAPWGVVRTVAAALFFSLFMQSFHLPVGPSELHFVGAMAMYLTFGFTPTLLGFAAGLALQGLAFEPTDLVHLGVNSLSLMLPLIAVHYTLGQRVLAGAADARVSWRRIVQLDALYYSGVTAMVGFWLMIGETETPFGSWLAFAASYLVLVALEPVVTLAVVRGLKRIETAEWVGHLFVVRSLRLAA